MPDDPLAVLKYVRLIHNEEIVRLEAEVDRLTLACEAWRTSTVKLRAAFDDMLREMDGLEVLFAGRSSTP